MFGSSTNSASLGILFLLPLILAIQFKVSMAYFVLLLITSHLGDSGKKKRLKNPAYAKQSVIKLRVYQSLDTHAKQAHVRDMVQESNTLIKVKTVDFLGRGTISEAHTYDTAILI